MRGEYATQPPVDVKRGRRNLLLLFGIALTPVLLAMIMYFGGYGIPDGRTNKGELLQPARALPVQDWQFVAPGRNWDLGPESGWKIIYAGGPACEARCEELLHHARQTHIASGREQERIHRYYLGVSGVPEPARRAALGERFPGYEFLSCAGTAAQCQVPEGTPALYLADPLGNLILRYTEQADPRALLDDLKRLLKVSRGG